MKHNWATKKRKERKTARWSARVTLSSFFFIGKEKNKQLWDRSLVGLETDSATSVLLREIISDLIGKTNKIQTII